MYVFVCLCEFVSVCVCVRVCLNMSVRNCVKGEYQKLFGFDREQKTLWVGLWIFCCWKFSEEKFDKVWLRNMICKRIEVKMLNKAGLRHPIYTKYIHFQGHVDQTKVVFNNQGKNAPRWIEFSLGKFLLKLKRSVKKVQMKFLSMPLVRNLFIGGLALNINIFPLLVNQPQQLLVNWMLAFHQFVHQRQQVIHNTF
jgi:hypothetical protein